MYGSKAYHKANPGNGDGVTTEKFIFVSESDEGAFRPMTWNAQMQTFGTASQRYFISFAIGMINLNGIPLSMKKTAACEPFFPFFQIPNSSWARRRRVLGEIG